MGFESIFELGKRICIMDARWERFRKECWLLVQTLRNTQIQNKIKVCVSFSHFTFHNILYLSLFYIPHRRHDSHSPCSHADKQCASPCGTGCHIQSPYARGDEANLLVSKWHGSKGEKKKQIKQNKTHTLTLTLLVLEHWKLCRAVHCSV